MRLMGRDPNRNWETPARIRCYVRQLIPARARHGRSPGSDWPIRGNSALGKGGPVRAAPLPLHHRGRAGCRHAPAGAELPEPGPPSVEPWGRRARLGVVALINARSTASTTRWATKAGCLPGHRPHRRRSSDLNAGDLARCRPERPPAVSVQAKRVLTPTSRSSPGEIREGGLMFVSRGERPSIRTSAMPRQAARGLQTGAGAAVRGAFSPRQVDRAAQPPQVGHLRRGPLRCAGLGGGQPRAPVLSL